ncbi:MULTISPECIES: phospholipase D family protein [Klebsiella]|uniref:phospholipase D family protein n=1 Tax=Klebsiella TaxID=570 RepID=UPI000B41B90A|nr:MULTISPECIES: phospholipase D family protein [Klebsiella]ECE5989956.1 alcohol dehydrogenase [Salmonella enterica subsp. salamae]KAA1592147.1 alcohol dehydrogenase [Klebsiella pneumoniae]MCX3080673.1 phospholipase D family protein [Klebsiella michiganensis]MCY0821716.1 phospholipase D family protein [Klebsiella michiganensis]OVW88208.1 alcohol dehydrogenase [Klebsiella pneumoniae]
MTDLYTNRNSRQDFVKHAFTHHIQNNMDIFIASAFFTEFNVIDSLLEKGCHIRIIVRLGFPTSPFALEKLLSHKNVEARFFTNNSFHPKLYIFGDRSLLVGSANLTNAALLTNQEVMVSLNSEDHRFEELTSLFSNYWESANVLSKEAIKDYKNIYNKYSKLSSQIISLDNEVLDKIGDINYSNINRGKKHISQSSIFLESYRKSYQTSVYAFECIEEIYSSFQRKVPEEQIPLRLEIDSFFSFVRDYYATQETWLAQPLGWTDMQKSHLRTLVNEWLSTPWEHFEERIVPINYPLIYNVFKSPDSIEQSNAGEIVDALCVLHSFHDRLRFYKGGLDTLIEEFSTSNDISQIKKTITYLLYGKGDIIKRMSDCIYNDEFKLNAFGQSNVQELIGWINKENLPVINGRTTKVLRYFGFDVRQL